MRNRIYAIVTALCLVLGIGVFADTTGEITTMYVDSTGKAEIIGYFDNANAPYGAAMIMYDGTNLGNLSGDLTEHIMYIDQQPLGNNGTFYYHFQINEQFSQSPYVLKIQGGTMLTQTGTLREIPSKIYNVADNAIRIGNDVYDIGCPDYTPDKISTSIERGGNVIYYKIGGLWFDMLDPNATSSAYFTADNAVPEAEWDAWEIENYYQF